MKLFTSLAIVSLAALVACDDSGTESKGGEGAGGGSAGNGNGGGPGSGGTGGTGGDGIGGAPMPGESERLTITGEMTWNVTFDATAQSAGATDCAYTRSYVGVEDRSRPWLCPACETMFRAEVEMTAGETDCFSQVSEASPVTEEWIGYGDGVWYRGALLTSAQGEAVFNGDTIATTNTVPDLEALVGGMMEFGVAGAFKLDVEEGDPFHGFAESATYSCGWPKASPPPYTGDYTIVDGQTVPDGIFRDACGDNVRLHDFKGAYTIIDMSAMDCPPCQAMAGQEEAFVADLAAMGITVHVVTLLAPSLADPLGNTTEAMLNTWINNFDLTSPVLADTAWGLSMFIPVFGPEETGYPSWVLVDPDLNVLESASGFPAEVFEYHKQAILADMQ